MNPIIQVAAGGGGEKKRKELTDTAAVGNGGCVLNASNDWQFSHDWAVRLRALHLFTRANHRRPSVRIYSERFSSANAPKRDWENI